MIFLLKKVKLNKRVFFILTLLIPLILVPADLVFAQTIIPAGEIGFPANINNEDVEFGLPDGIVIVPVYMKSDEYISFEEFYKGLYFYTTDVLGFKDIPFHYVVSQNGLIYKGVSLGDERRIDVAGFDKPKIYIAYLTEQNSLRFSNQSVKPLTDLMLQIANNNSISPDNISVSEFSFIRSVEQGTVTIQKRNAVGVWNTSIASMIPVVKSAYSPKAKQYSVNIDAVELPAEQVNAGETISVSLTISNNGQTGIYGGTDNEIIATKSDGGNSQFFLNNAWLSRSQFPLLNLGENLMPGQETSITIQLRVPLIIGEISEQFRITNIRGEQVNSNIFEIKLNVQSAGRRIVEIGPTETGNLNVRDQASSVSNIITQVSTGQRFFLLEDAGNGWIKIEIDQQTSGWVAGWYLRYL